MTALLVISIILSTGSIVILWLFITRVSELVKRVSVAENAIGYIKADVDVQRGNILDLSASVATLAKEKSGESALPKAITYDVDTNTVSVAGNINATGWVASGSVKEE